MIRSKYISSFNRGPHSHLLLQELIDDFIFPASNVYLQYMKSGEFPTEQAIPVCSSPASINAGFELLVALAAGCVRNLKQIVDTLTDMYYRGKPPS